MGELDENDFSIMISTVDKDGKNPPNLDEPETWNPIPQEPTELDINCPRCGEENKVLDDSVHTCPHCKAEFCVGV